ncbi:MAG: transglutaminase-like domain-containing protein [Verrucomicrobiota bacterium]
MSIAANKRAIESLLADPDESTRRVVFDELLNDYEKHQSLINELCRSKHELVRQAASHLKQLQKTGQNRCLMQLHVDWDEQPDWEILENFCWELARRQYPEFKQSTGVGFLDQLAYQVKEKYHSLREETEDVEAHILALRKVIHNRYGFTGNHTSYYCPDNSYLNRVIESRKGIPLSLSLITIFTARRIGWEVQGLHLPSHFLCAYSGQAFDPFHDGVMVSTTELSERYMLPESEFDDLTPYHAVPAAVAKRILGNLLYAYEQAGMEDEFEQIQAYWISMTDCD